MNDRNKKVNNSRSNQSPRDRSSREVRNRQRRLSPEEERERRVNYRRYQREEGRYPSQQRWTPGEEKKEDPEKPERPEKPVKKKKPLSARSWILIIVLFIALTATLLLRHKAFNIRYIRVAGNTVLSDEEIIDQLGNGKKNIFLCSKSDIKKKLLEVPGIRSVSVKKELPNKLIVKVEEAYILAESDQEPPLLIDNEGIVLNKIPEGYSSRIKPIRVSFPERKLELGKNFSDDPREMEFLKSISHSKISDEVKKVVFNNENNIDIILNDVKVYFGSLNNISEKISTLTAVYNEIQRKDVDAKEIILNQGKNPIVVTNRAVIDKEESGQENEMEEEVNQESGQNLDQTQEGGQLDQQNESAQGIQRQEEY